VFDIGGRFDFDQPPALIRTALEHIDSDENVSVLKCAFEDRWNLRIADQLSRRPNRLFSISGLHGDTAWKHLASQQTDLSPLLDYRLARLARLHSKFRRVHSQIQSLETLRPGDESRFCEEHQC